jgi:hypothetical protein
MLKVIIAKSSLPSPFPLRIAVGTQAVSGREDVDHSRFPPLVLGRRNREAPCGAGGSRGAQGGLCCAGQEARRARIRVAFSFFTVLPAVLAFLGMDRVHISSVSWSGEFSTWKCGVNPSSMICFITQESSNTTFLGFLWGSKLFFVNADHPNK